MSNVVGVGVLDDPCFYIIRIFVGADASVRPRKRIVIYTNVSVKRCRGRRPDDPLEFFMVKL